jgi:DNA-binding SARP family transcriptional activator
MAGLLRQAETLLIQVWTITEGREPDLANYAAWDVAWLLVQTGGYAAAAEWFDRVAAPPAEESPLWPAAREAQVRLCLMLANTAPGPAAVPLPSPLVQRAATQAPPPSDLPPLKVTNLGHFNIARAGEKLPNCRARKSIALFRYLLTRSHREAHKEELMELLWPDSGPREAAHSLHVTVSALRRYLDPRAGSYLLFEAERYVINPGAPIEDDCNSFRQLADAAERRWRAGDLPQAQQVYADAIACYRGDYYVDDRDLTWAVAEREQLLTRYLSALDCLGRILIAQQRVEPAIEYYQRLLERDGYREDAHCQLMHCYWRLGRRGDAIRQYERCAGILMRDLGLEPMEETQALYRAIAGLDQGDRRTAKADTFQISAFPPRTNDERRRTNQV